MQLLVPLSINCLLEMQDQLTKTFNLVFYGLVAHFIQECVHVSKAENAMIIVSSTFRQNRSPILVPKDIVSHGPIIFKKNTNIL